MLQRPFHAVDATEVIVLPTNFAFEIELPSNPSTGYDWNFVIAASDVIRHKSYRYIKDSSRRLGVPGISAWSFETLERGNTKIYFSYEPRIDPGKQVICDGHLFLFKDLITNLVKK